MDYVLHILILAAIYGVLAMSLELVLGRTGLITLGHAVVYACGAYSSAVLTLRFGVSASLGLLAGMALAGAISCLVALVSLRLHADNFVIATFGLQVAGHSILLNWIGVTQGPFGMPGIPRPEILGWRLDSSLDFLLLSYGIVGLAAVVLWRVGFGPLGRLLLAIKEDEVFCRSVGKNVFQSKLTALVVGSMLAAVSGSIYAHYATYVDPTTFTVNESILIISMVIMGGVGRLAGPLLGAAVLVALPEGLRFVGLPEQLAGNLRQILYGLLLILVLLLRPRGLIGRYAID